MPKFHHLSALPLLLFVHFISTVSGEDASSSCVVTSFSDVDDAISSCSDIVIQDITVPGGKTWELDLQDGTVLTFDGRITFEYADWSGNNTTKTEKPTLYDYDWPGPLIRVRGSGVTVKGTPGSVLDGQGTEYWDGMGGNGLVTKPYFFQVAATNGSVFQDINLLNCPHHCVIVAESNGVTLSRWNVDCSEGDTAGGHNTDGFDIFSSDNVVIEDSVVQNQDDCIAVNQGSNMLFSRLTCSGCHGLSLSVGFNKSDISENTVKNITFSNCTVRDSANAIHIKTHNDGGPGLISDITYKDIAFSGITNFGVSIQEDYANGGSTGIPIGNVPIVNLQLINVHGSVSGEKAVPVYIFCGENGCENWVWSGVDIRGAQKNSSCNFVPSGYSCEELV